LLYSALLHASNYSFLDTSINYLDWTKSTQEKTSQKDFTYLELEGGAGWDWGEFYGFFDLENPISSYNDTSPDDLRFGLKPVLNVNISNGFSLHLQDYYLNTKSFYVSNFVVGVAYKYTSDFGLWIKPFIGPHYQNSTYYTGFNGYMFGWVFNYDFKFLNENFSLFQWNEIEFNRNKQDYKKNGLNGALSIWWNLSQSLKLGYQYRYAEYELGFDAYQSASIYSLKYYF